MARHIRISDNKGRDAEVLFLGTSKKSSLMQVTQGGDPVKKIRVIKSCKHNSLQSISKLYDGNTDAMTEAILDNDPEVDLYFTGRLVGKTTRVYLDQNLNPAYRIQKKECVFGPDGTLVEERIPKEMIANILTEHPLKCGKYFPKSEIYNKLVFAKKYQLAHTNGLTFDFLFDISKELHDKDALVMIGGGVKGNEPLVFQDGGKSYRAFLEGRILDNQYLLLLHLSNLELKGI